MLFVLSYSFSKCLHVLNKGSSFTLPLVLGAPAPLLDLLYVLHHLLFIVRELLLELLELNVDDVQLLFILEVGLAEAVRKLLGLCHKEFIVVL